LHCLHNLHTSLLHRVFLPLLNTNKSAKMHSVSFQMCHCSLTNISRESAEYSMKFTKQRAFCYEQMHKQKNKLAVKTAARSAGAHVLLPAVVLVVPVACQTFHRVLTLLQHQFQLLFLPLASDGVRQWRQHCNIPFKHRCTQQINDCNLYTL